jgi:hypothetical protein
MSLPKLYVELSNIDLTPFINLDFNHLMNDYPFVKKIYGEPLVFPDGVSPDEPHWLGYYDQTKGIARLYNFYKLYPKICTELSEQINAQIVQYNVQVNATNIRFGTTKSLVHRHVDEGIRGAINCFIKNGEAAHVNFYNAENELIEQFRTETGKSYYLNTTEIHEVVHDEAVTRFSLTFSIF